VTRTAWNAAEEFDVALVRRAVCITVWILGHWENRPGGLGFFVVG
jgi:hypothetical protein